ncbi:MAG: hypothetical protein ABL930_13740 [Pseudobdellovibrio sp.]
MYKLISILSVMIFVSACATVELTPKNVQQKVQVGVSQADALALFDFPDQYEKVGDQSLMVYDKVAFYFITDKMIKGFEMAPNDTLKTLIEKKDTRLTSASEIPNDLKNKIIFSKRSENHVNPYQAFAYLNDEANFIEAVNQEHTMDYYSTTSNALCIAIASGFVNATSALIKAGAYKSATLKDAKSGREYIKAYECVKYLKDDDKRAQINKILNPDTVAQKAEDVKPVEEAKKNQALESIMDWLKPVEKKPTDTK